MSGTDVANANFDALVQDIGTLPPLPDLSGITLPDYTETEVTEITTDQLVSDDPAGGALFNSIMRGFGGFLKAEFEKSRITGADYTKAYIALTGTAMSTAVQFLLNKDLNYWQSRQAQAQAVTAEVALETAKIQAYTAGIEAYRMEADYAVSKMSLATAQVAYDTAEYELTNIEPQKLALMTAQATEAGVQTQISEYNLDHILPAQLDQSAAQTALLGSQKDTADYQLSTFLPAQVAQLEKQSELVDSQIATSEYQLDNILPEQKTLAHEQAEQAHAQTSDTRLDGTTPVTGVLGEQKLLYAQQITSYIRNAEVSAAKLFTDSWITQKTIDEGLDPPTGFTNDSIDDILTVLKTNNFT